MFRVGCSETFASNSPRTPQVPEVTGPLPNHIDWPGAVMIGIRHHKSHGVMSVTCLFWGEETGWIIGKKNC